MASPTNFLMTLEEIAQAKAHPDVASLHWHAGRDEGAPAVDFFGTDKAHVTLDGNFTIRDLQYFMAFMQLAENNVAPMVRSVPVDLDSFEQTFMGEVHGIALSRRESDNAVIVTILTGDDGAWFISRSTNGFNSAWLNPLRSLMAEALIWMQSHCISNGNEYRFKD